jgi:hypothetical protein
MQNYSLALENYKNTIAQEELKQIKEKRQSIEFLKK